MTTRNNAPELRQARTHFDTMRKGIREAAHAVTLAAVAAEAAQVSLYAGSLDAEGTAVANEDVHGLATTATNLGTDMRRLARDLNQRMATLTDASITLGEVITPITVEPEAPTVTRVAAVPSGGGKGTPLSTYRFIVRSAAAERGAPCANREVDKCRRRNMTFAQAVEHLLPTTAA